MTKLISPLMSVSASGSIAGVLTFSNRRTGQQVRIQRKQKDIITVDRTAVRVKYSAGVAAWNLLTDEQKAVYNSVASSKNYTGYNLFIRERLLTAYYPRNPDLVNVAPYLIAPSVGVGNSGMLTASSTREFCHTGHKQRIRQSGTINRIRFYFSAVGRTTAIYFRVWRKNVSNLYDLVGSSENILSVLTPGEICTVDLSSPIAGVQEGDCYSIRIVTGAGTSAYQLYVAAIPNIASYYCTNEDPSHTDYDWLGKTGGGGYLAVIQVYMQAPNFVIIGDSIIAGHPAHYSFCESTDTTSIASAISSQINFYFGSVHQNMGIGSQTTTMILARLTTDLIDLKPAVAILYGSGNDAYSEANRALFLSNWTAMLNACQASDSILKIVVLLLVPANSANNTAMRERDVWNNELSALAASYSKAIVVDPNPYVGQFRVGGDEGNLWDIKDEYNVDNVHENAAGYGQIALAISNAF